MSPSRPIGPLVGNPLVSGRGTVEVRADLEDLQKSKYYGAFIIRSFVHSSTSPPTFNYPASEVPIPNLTSLTAILAVARLTFQDLAA